MSYLELLKLAAPETMIALTALLVLAVDLTALKGVNLRFRFVIDAMISCMGCVGAILWMANSTANADVFEGMLVVNPLTQCVKICLVGIAIATILLSVESDFTEHAGELLALILMALVGMMFLVSAEDILMIFVALELTSLSLYILTAFNKRDIKSAEASLKYFLFGGMSAAFTLFGLSLIYGLAGSTHLPEIGAALAEKPAEPLLLVAMIMVVIGFGFKIAVVPFHLWAPDAYQGAPAPSAAFIASGSKVASFFIFARVLMLGFPGPDSGVSGTDIAGSAAWHHFASGWAPVLAILAALSMILGNLTAIVQSSVRRLIAYSAIAHAGYMLLAMLARNEQGLAALIYYAVTYGLTTVGAFAVVAIVEREKGSDHLANFAGLSRRAPVVSFCMFVFMLSLAGIPPLAGFFGKLYLFSAVLKGGGGGLGLLWLVVLAVAISAVSFYYYLQVLKQIYVKADAPSRDAGLTLRPAILTQVVLVLIAATVILLGCLPNLLVGWILKAIGVGPT